MKYEPIDAELQISFYYRLKLIRDSFLREALRTTIQLMNISEIDKELAQYVSPEILSKVASFGLRGEVFLPVPLLIVKNPQLIGYYRLLYGISQKEFYTRGPFGQFKKYEESKNHQLIPYENAEDFCKSLIVTGQQVVKELDYLSADIVHELQLLTLGPQFRGSRNTDLGKAATEKTFALIKEFVKSYILTSGDNFITIKNDSLREVSIVFSSDPDISIIEKLPKSKRNLVSIEIKGGTDYSNIHNRLGEAEKSHQKAKNNEYNEFWTIIRVELDYKIAKKESPTTSHFFNLDQLYTVDSTERDRFKDLLSSILSIRIQ